MSLHPASVPSLEQSGDVTTSSLCAFPGGCRLPVLLFVLPAVGAPSLVVSGVTRALLLLSQPPSLDVSSNRPEVCQGKGGQTPMDTAGAPHAAPIPQALLLLEHKQLASALLVKYKTCQALQAEPPLRVVQLRSGFWVRGLSRARWARRNRQARPPPLCIVHPGRLFHAPLPADPILEFLKVSLVLFMEVGPVLKSAVVLPLGGSVAWALQEGGLSLSVLTLGPLSGG